MSKAAVQPKVLKYEAFINDTLREDLNKVNANRDAIAAEIADYLQLQSTISKLQQSDPKQALKTKVDLGCNFYANAAVPDYQMIFVKAGMGIFIQLTLEEAKQLVSKRISFLEQVINSFTKDASKIKATIKVVTESLKELQGIKDERPAQRDIF